MVDEYSCEEGIINEAPLTDLIYEELKEKYNDEDEVNIVEKYSKEVQDWDGKLLCKGIDWGKLDLDLQIDLADSLKDLDTEYWKIGNDYSIPIFARGDMLTRYARDIKKMIRECLKIQAYRDEHGFIKESSNKLNKETDFAKENRIKRQVERLYEEYKVEGHLLETIRKIDDTTLLVECKVCGKQIQKKWNKLKGTCGRCTIIKSSHTEKVVKEKLLEYLLEANNMSITNPEEL